MAETKKKVFKISNALKEYVFNLNDITKNEETRDCLRKYLKREFNLETLEFLEALDKLEKLCSNAADNQNANKVREHVQFIIDIFIKPGAKMEIHISERDKEQVYKSFQEIDSSNESKLLGNNQKIMEEFKELRTIVEREICSDVLPHFLRSDLWVNLINDKGDTFLKKVGKLKKAVEMSYKDSDFIDHVVRDADIEFLRYIIQDNYDWKLVGFEKTQRITAFSSKRMLDFFPNVSWLQNGASCSKYVGILPFSFELCEHYLLHGKYVSQFDPNVTRSHMVEYYNHEELKKKYPNVDIQPGRTCSVIFYDIKFPFPLAPRIYPVATSCLYDTETNEAILISKPCYHPELDKINKKKICLFQDFQIYSLKKLDANRTQYCQIHLANTGSIVGNKLSKLVIFHRGKQLSANITKFLKTMEKKGIPDHDYNDGLMRPYIDYKRYLETLSKSQQSNQSRSEDINQQERAKPPELEEGDVRLNAPAHINNKDDATC